MLAAADHLVILLHGVGANGRDLAPLGAIWRRRLPPRTLFANPDAPDPCGAGPGCQWFSLIGATAENRPGRVTAARDGFDRIIASVLDEQGFAGNLDRVALVGFSQGATMAFDAVASGRWPVAGLVAFSGRFAIPEPLEPAAKTPVFIAHGALDPVIPATEAEKATVALRSVGFAVETHVFPGVGHAIAPKAAAMAGAFLRRVFAD